MQELRREQSGTPAQATAADANLMLKSVQVSNFRNYTASTIDDLGMLNIFIGPNASGKTSLVEAIQLLTACKSFRTAHMADVVRWGTPRGVVRCDIEGNGRHLVEELSIEEGKRIYALNGNHRSIETIKGTLPAVVFCPDDLELVKGSNSSRLSALDDIASQMSKNFRGVKSDYARLVRQKNQALKDEASQDLINSINSVLMKVSAQYTAHRQHIAHELAAALGERYSSLAGESETAGLSYVYSWDALKEAQDPTRGGHGVADNRMAAREELVEEMKEALASVRDEERIRKKALVGAHADKVFFQLDGRNATKFASQGQQRSIVLAFKLAELDILARRGNQLPLLLLDDVMSELDRERRERFMSFVDKRVQTFVTTTNQEYFDPELLERAQVYIMPLEGEAHHVSGQGEGGHA